MYLVRMVVITRETSVVTSPHFTFLAVPDKRIFTVHSALVAHDSNPLNVLVNGSMLEAKERCATLQETDEATFVRFSQYAYTGDYDAADPDTLLSSSTIESTQAPSNGAPLYSIEDPS
jgi:hypothetical protein